MRQFYTNGTKKIIVKAIFLRAAVMAFVAEPGCFFFFLMDCLSECMCVCVCVRARLGASMWLPFGNGLREPHHHSKLPPNDSFANSACVCVCISVLTLLLDQQSVDFTPLRPGTAIWTVHLGLVLALILFPFCLRPFKRVSRRMISVWMIYNVTVGTRQSRLIFEVFLQGGCQSALGRTSLQEK